MGPAESPGAAQPPHLDRGSKPGMPIPLCAINYKFILLRAALSPAASQLYLHPACCRSQPISPLLAIGPSTAPGTALGSCPV